MHTYQLYAMVNSEWRWVAKVEAENNADAARQIPNVLPTEHYGKPLSIKQDDPQLPPPPTDKGN